MAANIFTALSLIDSLAINSIKSMSLGVTAAGDYYSAIKRIQEVLLLEELESHPHSHDLDCPTKIVVEEMTTSWNRTSQESIVTPKRKTLKNEED